MDSAQFILRAVIGLLFIGHGTQKLFGWYGGSGIDGATKYLRANGYPKARSMAYLSGVSEAAGGALLLTGFLFPMACAAIIGVMINAIVSVHAKHGLWVQKGGSEYPLVLAAIAAALSFMGPGSPSLDRAFGIDMAGGDAAAIAIALGVFGATFVLLSRRRNAGEDVALTDQPADRHIIRDRVA